MGTKITKIIPTMPEVLREAIIVAAGALLATLVVRSLPDNVRGLFSLNGITGGGSNNG